jgi:tellurite resistance protein TehA-like permease
MPWNNTTDLYGIVGALVISIISGIISISRRILNGHPSNCLWVISEFLTAILCGYLMYEVFPYIEASVPKWFTLPVAIAIAAHIGGKVFQEAEAIFLERYIPFLRQK